MAGILGFTVVPFASLHLAKALGKSFMQHHTEDRFVIVVVDYPLKVRDSQIDGIEYLRAIDIPQLKDCFHGYATAFGREHLVSFIRPYVAEHLAENHQTLICFSPTKYVYSPLVEMHEATTDVDLVVVPKRFSSPLDDDLSPTPIMLYNGNIYDTGCFAINGQRTAFIDWWKEQVRVQPELGFPTDYSFLDYASTVFKTHVCSEPNYGLSYWNYDERALTQSSGSWFVDELPLRTANFQGFDWKEPYWISRDIPESPRSRLSSNPSLKKLFSDYAQELELLAPLVDDLPVADTEDDFYGWGDYLPGASLTSGLRYVYRAEWAESGGSFMAPPPNPFSNQSIQNFFDWLEGETTLKGLKVQRFVLATLIDRPDIHQTFVHGRSIDYASFGEWLFAYGRAEAPITRVLKYLPPELDAVLDIGRDKSGVDVIGSLTSEHGLGEAGRLLVSALRDTDEEISTISFSPVGIRGKHPFLANNESKFYLTIVALNPEQSRDLWKDYGEGLRNNRYVIGQWFWELEIAPPWYAGAFREKIVDELWAPTRFIEEMLKTCVPANVPVKYMPLPFECPVVSEDFSFETVGLARKFTFLFTFDFGSVMKRKNPDGVIEAFKKAFVPNEGPQLVIKSINGHARPREFEKLMWARDGREDIVILDCYLDNDENAALIALSDCYVSLHRSEGLGLTMAEAMLLGKPVIATRYSGNLDFMNNEISHLVPWTYTKVGSGADAYPSNALWAEPDLNESARLMRYVYEHQDESREMGQRAKLFIEKNFSTEATGDRMQKRLKELRGIKR
jgi:glycosyltransferase involved in cell wall biosynthesis